MSASLREDFDLTEARRNKGWSKAEAARECGIGYATWCRAEEHLAVSDAIAKGIADKFGLTVSEDFPEKAAA